MWQRSAGGFQAPLEACAVSDSVSPTPLHLQQHHHIPSAPPPSSSTPDSMSKDTKRRRKRSTPVATSNEPYVHLRCDEVVEVEMHSDEARSTDCDEDDEDEAVGSCENNRKTAPKRRRMKNPSVLLDEETERMLAEWLEEEAEFIYNKGLKEYKDKAKVCRAFDEKAKTLNPPISGQALRTWFFSHRSRFGRLTAEKSGQGSCRQLTDRERWILNIFHFLQPHIVRHRKPRVLAVSQTAEAAATRPPAALGPSQSRSTSPDVSSLAIEEPRSRKTPTSEEGVLETIVKQAEVVRDRLEGVIVPVQDPDLSYWRSCLSELAKDCVGVGPELRVGLKVELLSTIQRFRRATIKGLTRPTKDLQHHTNAELNWEEAPPAAVAPPPVIKPCSQRTTSGSPPHPRP
ncbi:hypothetical protein E2C01_058717 [Portunus trituberculatus]|uniref:MADF domain-containing protein n=1 Tax=Portunus trituberculatus TaxID=210409 RepID=A0A5B7H3T3_PORTR|nr:hypothetical protein [Portunus trituberculatus]